PGQAFGAALLRARSGGLSSQLAACCRGARGEGRRPVRGRSRSITAVVAVRLLPLTTALFRLAFFLPADFTAAVAIGLGLAGRRLVDRPACRLHRGGDDLAGGAEATAQ